MSVLTSFIPSDLASSLVVALQILSVSSAMPAKRKSVKEPEEQNAKKIRAAAKAAANIPTLNGGAEVNANLQARLATYDAKIKDHFGAEILLDAPTSASGTPKYDARVAAAALGKGDAYTASCPLFWLNLQWEMQPAVPRYQSRINALQEHFFDEPAFLKDNINVMLNPGELPHDMRGALKACDPPEMRDAFRQAVAKAIEERAPRKKLNDWKDCLMSVVIRFEVRRFQQSWAFVRPLKKLHNG